MRRGMVLAIVLLALASCDRSDLDVYTCLNPDKGHKDANGDPDPCHRNDLVVPDAGETCMGLCLPGAPAQWFGPALVWMGAEADAPPCPARAHMESFTARRPQTMQPCATCSCDTPIGSCVLPATVTANSVPYPGTAPGATHTSFDPPASWSGTCTSANAIPAGKLCGGVPCVQSVTIAPLTMNETGCLPHQQPNVPPPPTWGTFTRACVQAPSPPVCASEDGVCVPAAPGAEFKQCISQTGDPDVLDCPSSYPNKSVFYKNFLDDRMCAPCTCGAPEGSTCTGSIGLFSDGACSVPLLGGPAIPLDATAPQCHDIVPTGSALGSKSASEPIYAPGKCPVTGGEKGDFSFTLARVICCQGTP